MSRFNPYTRLWVAAEEAYDFRGYVAVLLLFGLVLATMALLACATFLMFSVHWAVGVVGLVIISVRLFTYAIGGPR